MTLQATIVCDSSEDSWSQALTEVLQGFEGVSVRTQSQSENHELGQLVFIDHKLGQENYLKRLDRKCRALFLVIGEDSKAPQVLKEGLVDDVLVYPFRRLEVLSRMRHYEQILNWDQVNKVNESFVNIIERLKKDLRLAERLQKAKTPKKFPVFSGLKINSRYLAGLKAGGDFFDIEESQAQKKLSLIFSHSSSYGLSSAFLSALMRVALKLTPEESVKASTTLKRIHSEILTTLDDKDELSIFYGILDRKTFELNFVNLGNSKLIHVKKGESPVLWPNETGALKQTSSAQSYQNDSKLTLLPEDRLLLVSEGLDISVGGTESLLEMIENHSGQDPLDLLNDLFFTAKSQLKEPDDVPARDGTAMIIDVEANVLRLAKR